MTFDDWCKQNNIPDNVTTVCRMAFNARNREIKSLGERCNQLQKDKGNLTDRVRELEQQIEKMKCCSNCAFQLVIGGVRDRHCVKCNACSEWELED